MVVRLWWDGDEDDDNVHFILDQHAELDFNNDCLLKQQSADIYVASLRNIILILNQPVFGLTP